MQLKLTSLINNVDAGKLVLRLCLGVLMLFHGIAKLSGENSIDFLGARLNGVGLPAYIAYGVYVGEVLAPLMIIAGAYCRTGAMLIVINMLFAIGLVHMGDIFSLSDHGGWRLELQGFYLFCAMAIMLLGSGKYAIKPN